MLKFIKGMLLLSVAIGIKSQSTIPEDFLLGVATSSYQIEGAWNEDGKTISEWDARTHETPSMISDGSSGDVACDSYHKWEDDIQNLKALGVDHYRFSLAWTRILPDAFSLNVNQAGVDYYNNLINGLIENGIKPVVTIYHWDQPQRLNYLGGVANDAWIQFYVNYATTCFRLFGDRVKSWVTFNEANIIAFYFNRAFFGSQPQYPSGVIEYLTVKTILIAHARAYHVYDKQFRKEQKGEVGIVINFVWNEPASDSPQDVEGAERRSHFDIGTFANPIFNFDYPKVVTNRVHERSILQGCAKSRLEPLTLAEKLLIKGTADFLGLNYYTTLLVSDIPEMPRDVFDFYNADIKVRTSPNPAWPTTGSDILNMVPWGLRKALNWIKNAYNNPKIFILECGYSDRTGNLEDDERINFLRDHLNETIKALEDGVNVIGFTAWSFLDNFEWTEGYLVKFGFFSVDFNDTERTRTPRKSAEYFKKVTLTRNID